MGNIGDVKLFTDAIHEQNNDAKIYYTNVIKCADIFQENHLEESKYSRKSVGGGDECGNFLEKELKFTSPEVILVFAKGKSHTKKF